MRLALISSINSDGVIRHRRAISRNPFQKASSRLTLVRWPPMATERFTIVDCMNVPRPHEPGAILKGSFGGSFMADWRTVCVKRKTPGCYRGLPRSVSPSAVLEHGPPLEPRNGRVTDSIRPADIGRRLASLAACDGFLNLEWAQLRLASEPALVSAPPMFWPESSIVRIQTRQRARPGSACRVGWSCRSSDQQST